MLNHLLSFLIILQCWSVLAQRTVTGVVYGTEDSTYLDRLAGVNVIVKGSTNGTVTRTNGSFSINISDDSTTLIFSFIGFHSKEIFVGNQETIDVVLNPFNLIGTEIVIHSFTNEPIQIIQTKNNVTKIYELDTLWLTKTPYAHSVYWCRDSLEIFIEKVSALQYLDSLKDAKYVNLQDLNYLFERIQSDTTEIIFFSPADYEKYDRYFTRLIRAHLDKQHIIVYDIYAQNYLTYCIRRGLVRETNFRKRDVPKEYRDGRYNTKWLWAGITYCFEKSTFTFLRYTEGSAH